jgi:hypothetical protein
VALRGAAKAAGDAADPSSTTAAIASQTATALLRKPLLILNEAGGGALRPPLVRMIMQCASFIPDQAIGGYKKTPCRTAR